MFIVHLISNTANKKYYLFIFTLRRSKVQLLKSYRINSDVLLTDLREFELSKNMLLLLQCFRDIKATLYLLLPTTGFLQKNNPNC